MAKMGDWRNNKDDEVPLDAVGGVNILVKADVHRSGEFFTPNKAYVSSTDLCYRYKFPLLCFREPSRNRGVRQDGEKSRISSLRAAQLCNMAY